MKIKALAAAILAVSSTATVLHTPTAAASELVDAISNGKVSFTTRLRYEAVNQDNDLDDAKALNLRTRLGYTTGNYQGFTGTVEFEDSRIVMGVDDYAPVNADFSVIAEPETTEVDQAFIQYKKDGFTAKLGRQVVVLDNQRFIGHVGWRGNRQTFDAARLMFAPSEDIKVDYTYIDTRNTIFGTQVKTDDHFLNLSYKTPAGKLTAYKYIIENDGADELDTIGLRFAGSQKLDGVKVGYVAEYASQTQESDGGDLTATYLTLEGSATLNGVNFKAGYESLGSDDGEYGFKTPYATGHKFNGWADQFLGTPAVGLNDLYVSVSGKAMGVKLAAIYHDFSADEGSGDLGSELDLLAVKKCSKNLNVALKYAAYSAGDEEFNKVDTDKLWLWTEFKF